MGRLRLVPGPGEFIVQAVSRLGQFAAQTVGGYLAFALGRGDDTDSGAWLDTTVDHDVRLSLVYLDTGTETITATWYDSSPAEQVTTVVTKGNTGYWQVARVDLTNLRTGWGYYPDYESADILLSSAGVLVTPWVEVRDTTRNMRAVWTGDGDWAEGAPDIQTARIGDGANYANFATDGELTLVGTARVKRELRLEAFKAAKGAGAPTDANRAVGASGGVLLPVTKFSKTTQNDVHFVFHAPSDLDATVAVHFHFMWLPGAAWTAGNYLWKMEYLAKNENGVYNTGAPTTIQADVTPANATDAIETEIATDITFAAEQMLWCHFYRDVAGDNGDDTGDLIFFELEYTADKLGVAT